MKYKVVPFVAIINPKEKDSSKVAHQLEEVIENYSNQGWEYVRLESVTSFVTPIPAGCFDKGQPGYTTTRQMIVFKRNA